MSATATAWSNLQCNGGIELCAIENVSLVYGRALDNTEGVTAQIERANTALLANLSVGNVIRVHDPYGVDFEYIINNLQDDLNSPLATITAKPVELLLNRAIVIGSNATRISTVIRDTQSATDWVSQYILPSLAAAGQGYWSLGTIDVTASFAFTFTDQTCMWLIRQLLANETAVLQALPVYTGSAITGYAVGLVDLSVAAQPVALVGRNMLALKREYDDAPQMTIGIPSGNTFSGNDEPERPTWYCPFRVAALTGAEVALEDPSGLDTTILASDGQPLLAGHTWRLGCITPPVLWKSGATLITPLFRTLYIAATKVAWGAFANGVRSQQIETRALGTNQTTSLTGPVMDLYYVSGTDTLYCLDGGGSRVTPYTSAGPTVGTPISVGANPRRCVYVTAGSLNRLLIGHGVRSGVYGTNAVEQINLSTNTVTATSPAMANPAHLAVKSDTAVYIGSDSLNAVYKYNATANTVTLTITNGATGPLLTTSNGFASAIYCPTQGHVWAFGSRNGSGTPPPVTTILIIDTATDTIIDQIDTSTTHGQVTDCLLLNGRIYGVTDDGLLVCYDPAVKALVWARRHAQWPSTVGSAQAAHYELTWVLQSIAYLSDVDTLAIGTFTGYVSYADAQTGGAMIARTITAALAGG